MENELKNNENREEILLLAELQLQINRLKVRDNWEKTATFRELEKARDLLLVAVAKPAIRTEIMRLTLDLLNQMK